MTTPISTSPTPRSSVGRDTWLWAAVGAIGSVGLAAFGSRVGAVIEGGPRSWWFGPVVSTQVAGYLGLYCSAALLVAAWLAIGRQVRDGVLGPAAVTVLAILWSLPLLIGPPLFSRDVYSYVAQGVIARHGHNPYLVAPSVLGHGALLGSVASVWRGTPTPYGPLFVVISKWLVGIDPDSIAGQTIALRGVELLALGAMAAVLTWIARRVAVDPARALWLVVLSPLGLLSFVASGHNDAFMLVFLLAGIALALDGHPRLGILLCTLGALIKVSALIAVVFIVASEVRTKGVRQGVRFAVQAGGVAAATAVAVTEACGFGWRWLSPSALSIPTELRVLSTPAVSIGVFLSQLLSGIGAPVQQHAVVTVTQDVLAAVTVLVLCMLLWRVREPELVPVLGIALFALVLGSPTLWPWYLLWGAVLLAVSRWQDSLLLALSCALAMFAVGPSGHPLLQGLADLAVTAGCLAGVVWLIQRGRWRQLVGGSLA